MNFIKSVCCYSNERATDISNDEHAERLVLDHQHWKNYRTNYSLEVFCRNSLTKRKIIIIIKKKNSLVRLDLTAH